MARGESGRIVLEIDPAQKDDLYSALTKDGFTLKDWFLRQAEQYIRERGQLSLFVPSVVSEKSAQYGVSPPTTTGRGADSKSKRTRTKPKTK